MSRKSCVTLRSETVACCDAFSQQFVSCAVRRLDLNEAVMPESSVVPLLLWGAFPLAAVQKVQTPSLRRMLNKVLAATCHPNSQVSYSFSSFPLSCSHFVDTARACVCVCSSLMLVCFMRWKLDSMWSNGVTVGDIKLCDRLLNDCWPSPAQSLWFRTPSTPMTSQEVKNDGATYFRHPTSLHSVVHN
jgi:hypothetical protein